MYFQHDFLVKPLKGVYVNYVFENHIKPGQSSLLTNIMVNDFKHLNVIYHELAAILTHQKKLTQAKTLVKN